MKLSTAKALANILLAMRINRIPDKEAKSVIMKDLLALRNAVRGTDADGDELAKKFREDWADEICKAEKSDEYKKAEKEVKDTIIALYEQEAGIELTPIKAELLFNPELWGENDTLGQIANTVDFLVENGLATE